MSTCNTITPIHNKAAYVFVAPKETKARRRTEEKVRWENPIPTSRLYVDTETEGLFQSKNALMLAKLVTGDGNKEFYFAQGTPETISKEGIQILLPGCIILDEKDWWEMVFRFNGKIIGANPLFDMARGGKSFDIKDTEIGSMPIIQRNEIEIAPQSFGNGVKHNRNKISIQTKEGFYRIGKEGGYTYTKKFIKKEHMEEVRDVLQIGGCILGYRSSLGNLAKELGVKHQKEKIGLRSIGQNKETLKYLIGDVAATEDTYNALGKIIGKDFLAMENGLYSSASIGKWVLKQIGIEKPLCWNREELFEAYFGGRSEVNYIGEYQKELHALDFFSQYPTLQIILGLQRFLLAKEVVCCDQTPFLVKEIENLTIEDLGKPENWRKYSGVVLNVDCEGARVPVRTVTNDEKSINVSLPYTYGDNLWYSVFDYLAAKMLGKAPTIKKVLVYYALGKQENLKPYTLFGIEMHPETFYLDLLKYRVKLKEELKELKKIKEPTEEEEERKTLVKDLIYGVKIILNSTSYGTSIERQEKPVKEAVKLSSTMGEFSFFHSLIEGKYTIPIIGVQITAGARLQIAISEKIEQENTGHGLVQIDTDGLVVGEDNKEIQAFFHHFSPIPEIEYLEDDNNNKPVWFYGIAPKRYIKYTKENNGEITPIKDGMKEHGLGAYKIKDREKLVKIGWKLIHDLTLTTEERKYIEQPILIQTRINTNNVARANPRQKPYSFGAHTKPERLYEWEEGDNEYYIYNGREYTPFYDIENIDLDTKEDIIRRWFAYRGKKYIQPEKEGWVKIDSIHITEKIPITKIGIKGINIDEVEKIGKKRRQREEKKEDKALIEHIKKYRGALKELEEDKKYDRRSIGRGLTDIERQNIKMKIREKEIEIIEKRGREEEEEEDV